MVHATIAKELRACAARGQRVQTADNSAAACKPSFYFSSFQGLQLFLQRQRLSCETTATDKVLRRRTGGWGGGSPPDTRYNPTDL